jgi:Bifunctional DNA primase/polymerase, N-terminal
MSVELTVQPADPNGHRPEPPDMMMNAALEYVWRGLAVVPLHTVVEIAGEMRCTCSRWPCPDSPGKHPRPGHGVKKNCATADAVREAWAKWPDANIGLVPPDDFFVLDLDGEAAIRWHAENGGDPATRTAITGSGEGRHVWYRLPAGVRVANGPAVQFDGQHAEVRVTAAGMGILVAPPSLHPSGGRYRWLDNAATAVEAPTALLDALKASRRAARSDDQRSPADVWAVAAGMVAGSGRDTHFREHLRKHWELGISPGALRLYAAELARAYADPISDSRRDDAVRWILGLDPGSRPMAAVLAANMGADAQSAAEETPVAALLAAQQAPLIRHADGRPVDVDGLAAANLLDGGPFAYAVELSDPRVYRIYFPHGPVEVAERDVGTWHAVWVGHVAAHSVKPSWTAAKKNGDWIERFGALIRLVDVQPPPGLTHRGRTLFALRLWAHDVSLGPGTNRGWNHVWTDDGRERAYFRFSSLVHDVTNPSGAGNPNRLTGAQLRAGIEALGGEVPRRGLAWVPLAVLGSFREGDSWEWSTEVKDLHQ